jgi:hypothetical protein
VSRGQAPAARRVFRPALEALEERWQPSTLKVTNTRDGGTGSLRAEIAAAHNGDTIAFAIPKTDPGYDPITGVFTIALTGGELLIKHSVTIGGPSADVLTISGSKHSRVFEVAATAKSVALSGLTIGDGFTAGNSGTTFMGGGILNESTLALTDCTLAGNSAPQGGAINNQAALRLTNCTLSGNSAINGGAGDGGAIINFGPLTVSGCDITGNSADSGGGIWNGGSGTATINAGTTVSGNSAIAGGGIYNWTSPTGTLTIDWCTLSGNSARGSGGGIFDLVGNITIEGGSALTGNAAVTGGGIYVNNNASGTGAFALTISNCTLAGNSATQGGGIYLSDPGRIQYTVTVSGCLLYGNTATVEGGAIFSNSTAGTLTVSNSTFGNPLANGPDDIVGPYVDGGDNSFGP